jgi:hypothetical protein
MAATGELIAFLDSDDRWEPTKLERQVAVFERHPDTDVVFHPFRWINEHGELLADPVFQTQRAQEDNLADAVISGELPVATDTVMVRKEVFQRVGAFDERYSFAEDLDLWIRLTLSSKARFIDERLTLVRLHGSQLTRTSRAEMWMSAADVIRKNASMITGNGLPIGRYLAKFYAWAGSASYLDGRRIKALRFYVQSIMADPSYLVAYRGLSKTLLPRSVIRHRIEARLESSHMPETFMHYQ